MRRVGIRGGGYELFDIYVGVSQSGGGLTYDILGYVGSDFNNYDEAFAAAKQVYPDTNGVIVAKGVADDKMLSKGHFFKRSVFFGYYAVKFTKDTNPPPAKKFLGIF